MKDKPKRGRPSKGKEGLRGRIQVRCTEAEEKELRQFAARCGTTPSEWGRTVLLTTARLLR